MSEKVILWRRAGARRADIRRICLTEPQADIAGGMRDAGCESELQTANCKLQTANCKLQTGSLDVLRSSAVETRVNWATQSFQTRQPSRIFELRVFEPSRLPVFPSSRLHVFTSSRLRDFEISKLHAARTVLESLERFNSPAHSLTSPTLPLLRLSPSLVRARPTRVGRLASPHRATPLGCERPEAVAPRHAARTP
ncbi:hypothetical protein X947_4943 [Burkholderia pseudomallei MSHR7334]|nr:hypothetical protein X947_4943 [Burkholderia pseudomallei MSHR7334]